MAVIRACSDGRYEWQLRGLQQPPLGIASPRTASVSLQGLPEQALLALGRRGPAETVPPQDAAATQWGIRGGSGRKAPCRPGTAPPPHVPPGPGHAKAVPGLTQYSAGRRPTPGLGRYPACHNRHLPAWRRRFAAASPVGIPRTNRFETGVRVRSQWSALAGPGIRERRPECG